MIFFCPLSGRLVCLSALVYASLYHRGNCFSINCFFYLSFSLSYFLFLSSFYYLPFTSLLSVRSSFHSSISDQHPHFHWIIFTFNCSVSTRAAAEFTFSRHLIFFRQPYDILINLFTAYIINCFLIAFLETIASTLPDVSILFTL